MWWEGKYSIILRSGLRFWGACALDCKLNKCFSVFSDRWERMVRVGRNGVFPLFLIRLPLLACLINVQCFSLYQTCFNCKWRILLKRKYLIAFMTHNATLEALSIPKCSKWRKMCRYISYIFKILVLHFWKWDLWCLLGHDSI